MANTLRTFVEERLTVMANRPLMWAMTTAEFVLQLFLLVEVSWVEHGLGAFFHAELNKLGSELGKGNLLPNVPLDGDWAKSRVEIARKYLPK